MRQIGFRLSRLGDIHSVVPCSGTFRLEEKGKLSPTNGDGAELARVTLKARVRVLGDG